MIIKHKKQKFTFNNIHIVFLISCFPKNCVCKKYCFQLLNTQCLIDDPRINERVTHSDRRGKFLKKMTNRVPLHEKLYYAFVPPHDFFLHAQIKQISKNI
jgi:hypothetical protein